MGRQNSGGNSRAARSRRAKLQLRDSKGRWIEMGRSRVSWHSTKHNKTLSGTALETKDGKNALVQTDDGSRHLVSGRKLTVTDHKYTLPSKDGKGAPSASQRSQENAGKASKGQDSPESGDADLSPENEAQPVSDREGQKTQVAEHLEDQVIVNPKTESPFNTDRIIDKGRSIARKGSAYSSVEKDHYPEGHEPFVTNTGETIPNGFRRFDKNTGDNWNDSARNNLHDQTTEAPEGKKWDTTNPIDLSNTRTTSDVERALREKFPTLDIDLKGWRDDHESAKFAAEAFDQNMRKFPHLEKSLGQFRTEAKGSFIAYASHWLNDRQKRQMLSLSFNPKYNAQRHRNNNTPSEYSIGGDSEPNPFQPTMDHEFGHLNEQHAIIANQGKLSQTMLADEFDSYVDTLNPKMNKNARVQSSLSEYGATNPAETIAESFAERLQYGDKARPFAKFVTGVMSKHLPELKSVFGEPKSLDEINREREQAALNVDKGWVRPEDVTDNYLDALFEGTVIGASDESYFIKKGGKFYGPDNIKPVRNADIMSHFKNGKNLPSARDYGRSRDERGVRHHGAYVDKGILSGLVPGDEVDNGTSAIKVEDDGSFRVTKSGGGMYEGQIASPSDFARLTAMNDRSGKEIKRTSRQPETEKNTPPAEPTQETAPEPKPKSRDQERDDEATEEVQKNWTPQAFHLGQPHTVAKENKPKFGRGRKPVHRTYYDAEGRAMREGQTVRDIKTGENYTLGKSKTDSHTEYYDNDGNFKGTIDFKKLESLAPVPERDEFGDFVERNAQDNDLGDDVRRSGDSQDPDAIDKDTLHGGYFRDAKVGDEVTSDQGDYWAYEGDDSWINMNDGRQTSSADLVQNIQNSRGNYRYRDVQESEDTTQPEQEQDQDTTPEPQEEQEPTPEPEPETEPQPEVVNEPESPVESSPVDETKVPGTDIDRTEPTTLEGEKFPPTRQQQDVIDSVMAGQNTLVQAKAGAGKTTTLEAISRRLKEWKDSDNSVLYIAFNKSVQTEAEKRMPDNVESRTGHSLAYQWGEPWMKQRMGSGAGGKERQRDALRRPDQIARHLGINRDFDVPGSDKKLDREEIALQAVRTVDRYAYSADDNVGPQHLPESAQSLPDEAQNAILDAAKLAWEDLQDRNGQLKFTFDHNRKLWALSRPDLTKLGAGNKKGAQVLFLDEAQDTPPVLAKVVADQNMQKVIVGDADQAIYGFTGATDYLSQADHDVELPLNKSWRFGPQIADAGNRFLQLLGSKGRVEGGGPDSNIVNRDGTSPMQDADAILVRSNAGMIKEVMDELGRNRTVGVPKGTKADLERLFNHAQDLIDGRTPKNIHEDLAMFRSWKEFQKEAEKGDDPKLNMINNLVNQYSIAGLRQTISRVVDPADFERRGRGGPATVPEKIDDGVSFDDQGRIVGKGTFNFNKRMSEYVDPQKGGLRNLGYTWSKNEFGEKKGAWVPKDKSPAGRQRAVEELRRMMDETQNSERYQNDSGGEMPNNVPETDVTISTAHKAKGLEWGRVRIGDDFKPPKQSEEDEEAGKVTLPDPEELRLAYVAVTRAEKELDPGSLSWVYDYTDENGGEPDSDSDSDSSDTSDTTGEDSDTSTGGDSDTTGTSSDTEPAEGQTETEPEVDTTPDDAEEPPADVEESGEPTGGVTSGDPDSGETAPEPSGDILDNEDQKPRQKATLIDGQPVDVSKLSYADILVMPNGARFEGDGGTTLTKNDEGYDFTDQDGNSYKPRETLDKLQQSSEGFTYHDKSDEKYQPGELPEGVEPLGPGAFDRNDPNLALKLDNAGIGSRMQSTTDKTLYEYTKQDDGTWKMTRAERGGRAMPIRNDRPVTSEGMANGIKKSNPNFYGYQFFPANNSSSSEDDGESKNTNPEPQEEKEQDTTPEESTEPQETEPEQETTPEPVSDTQPKAKVNRDNGEVTLDGEKIGSIMPGIAGWTIAGPDGKTVQHRFFRTQKEAVAELVKMWNNKDTSDTPPEKEKEKETTPEPQPEEEESDTTDDEEYTSPDPGKPHELEEGEDHSELIGDAPKGAVVKTTDSSRDNVFYTKTGNGEWEDSDGNKVTDREVSETLDNSEGPFNYYPSDDLAHYEPDLDQTPALWDDDNPPTEDSQPEKEETETPEPQPEPEAEPEAPADSEPQGGLTNGQPIGDVTKDDLDNAPAGARIQSDSGDFYDKDEDGNWVDQDGDTLGSRFVLRNLGSGNWTYHEGGTPAKSQDTTPEPTPEPETQEEKTEPETAPEPTPEPEPEAPTPPPATKPEPKTYRIPTDRLNEFTLDKAEEGAGVYNDKGQGLAWKRKGKWYTRGGKEVTKKQIVDHLKKGKTAVFIFNDPNAPKAGSSTKGGGTTKGGDTSGTPGTTTKPTGGKPRTTGTANTVQKTQEPRPAGEKGRPKVTRVFFDEDGNGYSNGDFVTDKRTGQEFEVEKGFTDTAVRVIDPDTGKSRTIEAKHLKFSRPGENSGTLPETAPPMKPLPQEGKEADDRTGRTNGGKVIGSDSNGKYFVDTEGKKVYYGQKVTYSKKGETFEGEVLAVEGNGTIKVSAPDRPSGYRRIQAHRLKGINK